MPFCSDGQEARAQIQKEANDVDLRLEIRPSGSKIISDDILLVVVAWSEVAELSF